MDISNSSDGIISYCNCKSVGQLWEDLDNKFHCRELNWS